MTKTPAPSTTSGQTDSVHKTIGKDKTKKVYLPRRCQLCETSFNPVSARALRCHNCNLNSSQPDDMQMEIASVETATPPPFHNTMFLEISSAQFE